MDTVIETLNSPSEYAQDSTSESTVDSTLESTVDSTMDNPLESTHNSAAQPFVSVIIPVFNDSHRLTLCLAALSAQTYPQDRYEIIVVDNASQDDIQSIVSQFEQATYAYEGCPGSYAARNRGIPLAQGEVIAFTDSDCIPATNWIEKGVGHLLRSPHCGLVGGRIELFFQNPAAPNPVELYDSLIAFPQEEYVTQKHFGATANVFTFKRVIDDVGMFNSALKSRGDLEWGQRVFAAGYGQIYAADTVVRHPARHSLKELRKKAARVVGGIYDLESRKRSFLMLKDVVVNLKPPVKQIYAAINDKRLPSYRQQFQVVPVMLFVHYVRTWEKAALLFGTPSKR